MAQVKLTKNELRDQQFRLKQLEKYLPTLQLKKAMLQIEVNQIAQEILEEEEKLQAKKEHFQSSMHLLSSKNVGNLIASLRVTDLNKHYENIAGVDVPHLDSIEFETRKYRFYSSPLWFDKAYQSLKEMVEIKQILRVKHEKKRALEKELRDVSIRVNLFEKIMIPRTKSHIKKIKVFLGDQQLASVAQAKMAKKKIEMRREKS